MGRRLVDEIRKRAVESLQLLRAKSRVSPLHDGEPSPQTESYFWPPKTWHSWLHVRLGRTFARRARHKRIVAPQLEPYLLLLPAALLIILLKILSSLYGVYLSFLDWNYLRLDQRFLVVGLKHYYAVLADPHFHTAVKNSLTWSVVVVPSSFLVGLYLALLLNEEVKAKSLFRTMTLVPWATPLAVVAIIWSFAFAPGIGPLNDLLSHLGMPRMKYTNWLANARLALPIVMGVQIWRWAPFFAITLLAGLQAVPSDLYDAAEVDGAGVIERFRYVTLPVLRPVAAVVLVQALIWSFHNFTIVFVMTEGGPVNATELLTIYMWRTSFALGQLGKAAAVGTLLVLILSLLGTVWVLGVMGREVAE